MRLKAIADHNRVVRLEDWNGLDLTGVNDMQSIIVLGQAQAAADNRILHVPVGSLLCGTTVPITTSMRGSGGIGYNSSQPRTVFIPGMTDGTPCLKATDKNGLDLRDFTVDTGLSVSSARNCIGLQLGQGAALISGATQANPCVVTTKYLHTFQTGQSVTIANIYSGMTALSGAYTVTRISATTFSVNVDSSGFGAYTSGGIVFPTDLGAANDVSRGVLENVTVKGVKTGFHLSGWLNKQLGLQAHDCQLGLDGSYLNTNVLDIITENCGQAAQLLGCNGLHVLRLEDEGGVAGSLVEPSTIDYSQGVYCDAWITEGTRNADTPWLAIGGRSYSKDIHIRDGVITATPGSAKSVTLDRVEGWALPAELDSGFSTTANTSPTRAAAAYVPAWTGSTTDPVIGNGTLTGSYVWHGNAVTVNINLTVGSTTTIGSGNYSFSLPFTARQIAVGAARLLDSGTAYSLAVSQVNAAASTVQLFAPAQVAHNYPFTWATGDTMNLSITYQASGTP